MKNSYIGLMADDSPGLLVGVLAILKSGNCFVPINTLFPHHRIKFIINDCRINILLTDKANYEKARELIKDTPSVQHLICIDDGVQLANAPVIAPVLNTAKNNHHEIKAPYCYVIYTSGSTGRPKGVPISHRNLVPLFTWFREYFRLGVGNRVLQNLSYTFDFGVFEILTTLLYGGRLYVVDKTAIGDYSYYAFFIQRRQINTLHTTPVFFNNIAVSGKKMSSINLLHLGGERLTGQIIKNAVTVSAPGCVIYNGYGPTEATINCAIFSMSGGDENEERDNIPIGRTSALHELYILGKHFEPQPIGVAGELCIAGPGLAGGYLNRPELTKQKFLEVQKPFFKKVSGPRGEIFYRTGDLARWLPDGNIEFLGRIDHQVKVRGFRIELGEIEDNLARHPAIKEAVVLARQHENGSNYLCAYIITNDKESLTVSRLREYLNTELP
ncbi:MAG TPA: amino acid adenylation domain-containing protein, partial [Candidatus Deferrimicrobium sp.]|nr:amino acid adenylation domain-containing protein [Candidatus Deferrimicrobium sp.]